MPFATQGFSSGYSSAEEHYKQSIKSNPGKCALHILLMGGKQLLFSAWLVGQAKKVEKHLLFVFPFLQVLPQSVAEPKSVVWDVFHSPGIKCITLPHSTNMNNQAFSPAVVMRSCVLQLRLWLCSTGGWELHGTA